MKLTKSELKQKISEKIVDNDDLVIELMEDIDDSFDVETLVKDNETLKGEVEELKKKYKERFLQAVDTVVDEVIDEAELGEVEVIDVKEI